tara:strand:- start:202270 stop:203394 length:1125 start_codon:yes stop_codon:yes gene_type:complete
MRNEVALKSYNTFGLDVKASHFFPFTNIEELDNFMKAYKGNLEDILILGGGSNILFSSDFKGQILHSKINYIKKVEESEDQIFLEVGSGLEWDEFVKYCVANKYYGAENMSLIPGNVGATAVQNAGAYGTEAKDLIHKVIAYDLFAREQLVLSNKDCKFEYRNSIFKTEAYKNRILITSIVYILSKRSKYHIKLNSYSGFRISRQFKFWMNFIRHLSKSIDLRKSKGIPRLDYRFLKNLLEDSGLLPLKVKRSIVIKTRTSKLPDINELGNVGSFFKNPIIEANRAIKLKEQYPDAILFPYTEGFVKVSAAWLIDKCGWSGRKVGDAGTLLHMPLTIVNYGKATSKDILELAKNVEHAVYTKFKIVLEKEVVVI